MRTHAEGRIGTRALAWSTSVALTLLLSPSPAKTTSSMAPRCEREGLRDWELQHRRHPGDLRKGGQRGDCAPVQV